VKYINLTKGLRALVDDEDYDWLSESNWRARLNHSGDYYACRTGINKDGDRKGKSIIMHREIMGNPRGLIVDHEFHDTLDNRKKVLRVCTLSDNNTNSRKRVCSSGYKGVTRDSPTRWSARSKRKYLGSFKTPQEAHEAYCAASSEFLCLGVKL